ncbi:MAG: DEAD/DEAH box helicase [Candidatus Lokiarchaeota archaeon]|nr:DEAD/DEAH box helicase [Candidatus Lokiarchaeota archaeon]
MSDDVEINKIIELLKSIDLRKDFIELASKNLYDQFGIKDIFAFINSSNDSGTLNEEKLIIGAYIFIQATLFQFSKSQILQETHFEEVARYLELLLRYSEKYKRNFEKSADLYLLTSICYDLADKIANAKVIIEKVKEFRRNEIEPLETWNNLQFIYTDVIIAYISRDIKDLTKNLRLSSNIRSSFEDLVNKDPSKFRTILGLFQMITSFERLEIFWKEGRFTYLEEALDILKKAKKNFDINQDVNLFFITELLEVSFKREFKRIVYNLPHDSILWKKYKKQLIKRGIIELWPSQIEAINSGILEKNDFVVSAPTSAGKSLIAEICIIASLASNIRSKIIYIVPSRALASQVYDNLAESLNPLGFNVGILVGGISMPELDEFILETSSVLIFTLEKFEILLNQNNKNLENLELIIIDEAHNLGSNIRGLNLEILITNLKKRKNKPEKIVMLSAVTPNPDEIANWLNVEKGRFQKSSWSPTRAVHSLLTKEGFLVFYGDLKGFKPNMTHLKKFRTKEKAIYLARQFQRNYGLSMIFSISRPKAEEYAQELYELFRNNKSINKNAANLIRFTMGNDVKLANYVEKGIAYHHAGLPPNIRDLIEKLIKTNRLKIVSATTTLAEGMNTPVSSIIIPSLWMRYEYLSKMLFRNIAGRAGRALESTEGFIILIETDNFEHEKAEEYIYSNTESIENVQSFFETILESEKVSRMHPKNSYEENKQRKATLDMLSLNREILSALVQRSFDGYSINKFLNNTFFGFRKEKHKFYSLFNNVKNLITNSLSTLEVLENPVVERHSPYKPTKFGYLCNNVGLLPTTMNSITLQLQKLMQKELISKKLIESEEYSESLNNELLNVFTLFSVADEIKLSSNSKNYLRSNFSLIILSWLKDEPYKDLYTSYFTNDQDNIADAVIFCEQFIKNYANWITYAINVILKDYMDYNVGKFLEDLPFYLTFGSLSTLNCLFQAFKISPRTLVLKKIVQHLIEINTNLKDRKMGVIIQNLRDLDFSDFIYPQISKIELKEVEEIWNRFKMVQENQFTVFIENSKIKN